MSHTVIKRILPLVICLMFVLTFYLPAAASGDKVEIRFKPGLDTMTVNSKEIKIKKPFKVEDNVLLPLRAVVEAFGAEINIKEHGKFNISYRNISIDFTIGDGKYTVNHVEKEFSALPVLVEGTTMVPVDFIADNFGLVVNLDSNSGYITMVLEDDGAISDFSSLLGTVNKSRIGNSYFNWCMDLPKGSQLSYTSFNSKQVYIDNENKGISLQISVAANEGKELKKYYDEINEDTESYFTGKVVDSFVDSSGFPSYAQFEYYDDYNNSNIQRIYISKKYIYTVVLTSYSERDLEKLKNNEYIMGIMNSFNMGNSGDWTAVYDTSTVSNGLVKLENFSSFYFYDKFLSWEMDISPEWDVLTEEEQEEPLYTKLGVNEKEYISVYIDKVEAGDDLEKYGDKLKEFYDRNYNPEYYGLIEKKVSEIGDNKAYNMVSSVTIGENEYIYDESLILSGNLVYDITIKAPKDKYKDKKESYYKMLETLKPCEDDNGDFEKQVGEYLVESRKDRAGKDDKPVDQNNKTYKYNVKIPGYWIKSGSSDRNEKYDNPYTGGGVSIEAVENTAQTRQLEDEEKFEIIKSLSSDEKAGFSGEETLNEKGMSIKVYTYRVEDEETGFAGIYKCYVMEKGKYSYCYYSVTPDIFASEYNLKEIESIWQSLTFDKK